MAWMCTLLLLCLALLHPSQETDSICQSQHGKVCKQNDTDPTKCEDERTKKQPDKCRHNKAEELERECKLPPFEGMFSNGGVCKITPTYKPATHEEKLIVGKENWTGSRSLTAFILSGCASGDPGGLLPLFEKT